SRQKLSSRQGNFIFQTGCAFGRVRRRVREAAFFSGWASRGLAHAAGSVWGLHARVVAERLLVACGKRVPGWGIVDPPCLRCGFLGWTPRCGGAELGARCVVRILEKIRARCSA